MSTQDERAMVFAVCGSPGAGKTTVATAIAREFGLMLLSRDEISAGLHVSGVGRSSSRARAESLLVFAACRFAGAGMSVVVENSVLSRELVDGLLAVGARIVVVHVVASADVIGGRLRDRVERGDPRRIQGPARGDVVWPGDVVLLEQFERGEMRASIFEPPAGAHHVVQVDTSGGGEPAIGAVVSLALGFL